MTFLQIRVKTEFGERYRFINTDHIVSIEDRISSKSDYDAHIRLSVTGSDGEDSFLAKIVSPENWCGLLQSQVIQAHPGFNLIRLRLLDNEKLYKVYIDPIVAWRVRNDDPHAPRPLTADNHFQDCLECDDDTVVAWTYPDGRVVDLDNNRFENVDAFVSVVLEDAKKTDYKQIDATIKPEPTAASADTAADITVDQSPATFVPPVSAKKPRAKKVKPAIDQNELGWD